MNVATIYSNWKLYTKVVKSYKHCLPWLGLESLKLIKSNNIPRHFVIVLQSAYHFLIVCKATKYYFNFLLASFIAAYVERVSSDKC